MSNRNVDINYRVAGDLGPPVSIRFEGQDLSVYTSVTMTYKYRAPSIPNAISIAGVVDPEDSSRMIFEFSAGELDQVGDADLEFKFVPPSGKTWTTPSYQPMMLQIRESLS